ncbi:protein kinase domain-containing protein [Pendulispora albinea]|uniref:Protein kinase n=1 Tax=Pendulispora albinea TaxID=2741071 RepID=A0ABZ2M576_9BACT
MQNPVPQRGPQRLGRYTVFAEIASGGMASVHLGRLIGSAGFARTVAIKRLHPHLARNPDFVAMFLDEARLVSRIRHPNVVHTLDVVSDENELLIVMEYIQGESLARIIRSASTQGMRLPPTIASAIMVGVLDGLHAAHEATSERGQPLGIVHRDVSPQNVIVGRDGVARVLDFGVAKAAGRVHETKDGSVKGKFAYMAPEQLGRADVDRRTDIFAASIVLWETLVGARLFDGDNLAEIVSAVVNRDVPPPSARAPEVPRELDAVVLKGLDRDADRRFATAHDMAVALERVCRPASAREVGEWVEFFAGPALRASRALVERIESETSQPSDFEAIAPTEVASEVTASPRPRHDSSTGSGSRDPSSASGAAPPMGPMRDREASFNSESHSRSIAASSFTTSSGGGTRPRAAAFFQPFQESIVPWWKALGVLTLLTIVTLGVIYVMVTFFKSPKAHTGPDPASPASSSAATAPPKMDQAQPAPSSTEAPAASAATPPSNETPAPTDSSAAAPANSAGAGNAGGGAGNTSNTGSRPRHRASHGGAPTGPTPIDCENPFIIDESGIKRPKPQCFGNK